MKYGILPLLFMLLAGCNQTNTPAENSVPGDVTETALPKGKYVLEEDVKNNATQATALGDVKNNGADASPSNDATKTDAVSMLKHRFKNLLIFHASDTMKINKSYLATLILGKDQVLEELKTEVLEADGATTDDIKQDTSFETGSKMKARLIDMSGGGNKGFVIELIGGEESAVQSITAKRKKTIWQWKLTPQTPGLQELRLSINVIEKDGEVVNLPARNIPVVIFAEPESFLSNVGSFFKNENTKWLLSAIFIPIFLSWYNTKRKNKKEGK